MCKQQRLYTQQEQRTIRDFKYSHKHDNCHYCGKPILENSSTVDHLLPYSRGGETVTDNLVMACSKCNVDKSDLTEVEYVEYINKKKDIILNDKTINTIKIMMDTNNGIETQYKQITYQIRHKALEKNEIEKCIRDLKFSASEGYVLCKNLKDCMIDLSDLNKKCTNLIKLKNAIKESNDKLIIVYNDLIAGACKDLRSSMGIGHLGDARKIS